MPCFNEEQSIEPVLDDIAETLGAAGVRYELLLVDDGSTDGTLERLSGCGRPHKLLRHRRNRGYGASIKTGLRAATHEWVVLMDADGQHRAEDVLRLMEHREAADMVVGARDRQGSHYWRMPGKLMLKKISECLVGQRIPDINSGFRLMKRTEALRYMHLCSDQFSFSTSMTLAFLSDRLAVSFVPITIRPRQGGQSQVRVKTGFSTFMLILRIIGTFNPLPIFMPPTVLLLSTGATLALSGLIAHHNVSDAAVLCLTSGMVMFCFGLLADQLALLRREVNKANSR